MPLSSCNREGAAPCRVVNDADPGTSGDDVKPVCIEELEQLSGECVWQIDKDARYIYVSAQIKDVLGFESSDLLGRSLYKHVPDSVAKQLKLFIGRQATRRKAFRNLRYFSFNKSGGVVRVETSGCPVYDEHDVYQGCRGVVRVAHPNHQEWSQLAKNNQLLEALRRVNRLIIRERNPDELLRKVCHLLVEECDYSFAWAGVMQAKTSNGLKQVIPTVCADEKHPYFDYLRSKHFDARFDDGIVGSALQKIKRCILSHTNADADSWQTEALRHGFQTSVAVPIAHQQRIYGVFKVYSSSTEPFDAFEADLLDEIAEDIGFSIAYRTSLKQQQLLSATVDAVANAVVITDANGTIQYVNPALSRLSGYAPKEVIGRTPKIFKSGLHNFSFYTNLWNTIAHGKPWKGELVDKAKSGQLYPIESTITPVRNPEGKITHYVCVANDITERKAFEKRLSYLALNDELTGLPNRVSLKDEISRALGSADRVGFGEALLYIDLDHFRTINDFAGHEAGDRFLIEVGKTLKKALYSNEFLARLGSDEFAIFIRDCDANGAGVRAKQLIELLGAIKFEVEGETFSTGASIGVATVGGTETVSATELLSRADEACGIAKARGRDRAHFYNRDDKELSNLYVDLAWSTRLRRALSDGGFQLVYQPIVQTVSGERYCYETLLRLRGEHGELIAPHAFMATAEHMGLMDKIDHWVTATAIETLAKRLASGSTPLRLAINLSSHAFDGSDGLLLFIKQKVKELRLPPGSLIIEVTESAAISNYKYTCGFMNELRALGCEFAMDDFGNGMSSYRYLKHFPVDIVKIDGSFVKNLADDPTDRAMVRSMNEVAHILGKRTVAEYVENERSLQLLRELEVDFVQGYHLGRPSTNLPD